MNTDLSVAPEIAQLAGPFAPASHAVAAPRTDGRIAGDLADLAATPQHWWDLVRFDHGGPVRVPLPDAPGTWLLVLPPGAATDCDCSQATALAGEAVETPGTGAPARPLRPGRVRVHGTRAAHRVHAAGPGYSVTLHVLSAGDGVSCIRQRRNRAGSADSQGRYATIRSTSASKAGDGITLREYRVNHHRG